MLSSFFFCPLATNPRGEAHRFVGAVLSGTPAPSYFYSWSRVLQPRWQMLSQLQMTSMCNPFWLLAGGLGRSLLPCRAPQSRAMPSTLGVGSNGGPFPACAFPKPSLDHPGWEKGRVGRMNHGSF